MSEPSFIASKGDRASEESRTPGARARLAAGGLAVLLLGYVLGVGMRSDGGLSAFLLVATIAAAFAGLYGLWQIAPPRRNRFNGRAEKPIEQFVEEANSIGVSLRVAREAYDLLRHHYPRPMSVDLSDDLHRDLQMSPTEILSVRAGLLGRADRLEAEDVIRPETVRQLLESVEAAPKSGVDRVNLRQRVTDMPFDPRPVVENLEFNEESSLADPDFLRRAHFKWVRRRDADYKGFRSRAHDRDAGKTHAGPFRRATELSRRLAIRQEAGRLAKLAAEKRAINPNVNPAWMPRFTGRDKAGKDAAHHGY